MRNLFADSEIILALILIFDYIHLRSLANRETSNVVLSFGSRRVSCIDTPNPCLGLNRSRRSAGSSGLCIPDREGCDQSIGEEGFLVVFSVL